MKHIATRSSNQNSGGLAVGPPHTGGGIKFPVAGKTIEVEGEEIAICASAYASTKQYKLTGTPKEILKVIELDHGCNVGELTQLTGGEYIICKRVVKLDKKVKASGTPKEIINYLQSLGGCRVENIKVDKPCDHGCDHDKKEDGGEVTPRQISNNLDKKLESLGFVRNAQYRFGKTTASELDYVTAFYSEKLQLYCIRGIHKFKTPLGENSSGIIFDFSNETEFWHKLKSYFPDIVLEDGGEIPNKPFPFFTIATLNQAISVLQGSPILTDAEFNFYKALYNDISAGKKYNRPGLEKLGKEHGITKFRSLKELAELAYVTLYRSVAMDPDLTVDEKYTGIQAIYHNQQNMNFGDQETLRLQQYSTPAPIAFLMGQWCLDEKRQVEYPAVLRAYKQKISGSGYKAFKGISTGGEEYKVEFADGYTFTTMRAHNREDAISQAKRKYYNTLDEWATSANIWAFEPSAGNGLLSVALNPDTTTVNELDPLRNKSLQIQGFAAVHNEDASRPLDFVNGDFDIVLSNPPFGSAPPVVFGDFKITGLEHVMICYALQKMKDDGRAAFIIGGHTKYDHKGRLVGRDREFFQFLIKNYQLLDVINVDGSLYAKQGTTVPIRIILIKGKKNSELNFPLYKDNQPLLERLSPQIIYNFMDLKKRIYGQGKIID